MFSHGITAWQDAAVGAALGQPDSLQVYLRAQESGALKARVVGALWWDRHARRRAARASSSSGAPRHGEVGFRATSVKVMQDGVVENFTAGLLDPYLDSCGCPTETVA